MLERTPAPVSILSSSGDEGLTPPRRLRAGDRADASTFLLTDHSGYELIDEIVHERPMSELASYVSGLILAALVDYARNHGGRAYPDNTVYQAFGGRIRKPDASWISPGQADALRRIGERTQAPDLAVEVVSFRDTFAEMNDKLADYKSGGVRLVWQVDPVARTIIVIDFELERRTILNETETLDGGEILPQFSHLVADFFPDLDDVVG